MPKNFYDPAFDGLWPIQSAQTHRGHAYTGTMQIGPAPHDGHRIDWRTSAGNYDGIGLVIDGRLWLAFGKEDEGYGLAVYHETHPGLEAVFTSQAFKGAVGVEKVPDCQDFQHMFAVHQLEGRQPDKVGYKGRIGFAAHGDVVLATWGFDGESGQLVGVGLLRHERLVAGYGFRQVYSFGCGCYELTADGGLRGEWAIPSLQHTCHEVYGKVSR